MRYLAFATDYDGTIAEAGQVMPSTLAALEAVKNSGRKLLLVTGRELDDVLTVFPEIERFDMAVVENGAVLYEPQSGAMQLLAQSPPARFFDALRDASIQFSHGRVITSMVEPHDRGVLELIRGLQLDLDVIYNKGSAMVLPAGVHKGSGLRTALAQMGIPKERVAAAGDAENDLAMFAECGMSVAVANALPSVIAVADYVARGVAGKGVEEFVLNELLLD